MLQASQYPLMRNTSLDLVYKALTSMAIEKTLLKVGKPVYDKVVLMLNEKHHCHLPDCYDHPEILGDVLKQVFGNAYDVIVKDIRKELEEFSHKEQMERFVQVINR